MYIYIDNNNNNDNMNNIYIYIYIYMYIIWNNNIIPWSPASRRGQDKRVFYRSAINSHNNAISMP